MKKNSVFIIITILSSIQFSYAQDDKLVLSIADASYSADNDFIDLKVKLLNTAEYSLDGIPLVFPESQHFSESAYNYPKSYYGLEDYSYHYTIKQVGECNEEMLDNDPYISEPRNQNPRRFEPLTEEQIFRLRGTVEKTFNVRIHPSIDLCNGPSYLVQIMYRPVSKPIDPALKEKIIKHMTEFDELVAGINADMQTSGFKEDMVPNYCKNSLKKLLNSYQLADELVKMEIISEPFSVVKAK